MSETSDSQEKTLEPTEKRLEDARKEGRILTSKDFFVFTTLAVGLALIFCIIQLSNFILNDFQKFFILDNNIIYLEDHKKNIELAFIISIKYLAIFCIPLLFVVFGTQFILTGRLNFSLKAAEFKGSKINPIQGMKKILSTRAIAELTKSVLKILFLIGVCGFVLFNYLDNLVGLGKVELEVGLSNSSEAFFMVVGSALIPLSLIAAFDVVYQRYELMKQLKMSHQEMKDELKQTEGSPEVRQKIRQLQRAVSDKLEEQRKSLGKVPEATAIITNPIHFSVALKYEMGTKGAPIIISMGRGYLANEIKKLGIESKISIYESPVLARALYFSGKIGEEIAEELYTAVATIFAFIYREKQGESLDKPNIDIPNHMRFNESGQKEHA